MPATPKGESDRWLSSPHGRHEGDKPVYARGATAYVDDGTWSAETRSCTVDVEGVLN